MTQPKPPVRYQLNIPRQVYNQIIRLPGNVRRPICRLINSLPENPRPAEAKPLRGHSDIWRYRIDRWRVVWRIYDDKTLIIVVKADRKYGQEPHAQPSEEE